jgi:hypothetical protein
LWWLLVSLALLLVALVGLDAIKQLGRGLQP